MNIKKITLLLIIMTMFSLAQENLTLEKAMQIALENNPNIRIAQNTEEISANNANPGRAGLLPSISINGGSNYQYSEQPMTSNKTTSNNAQIQGNYTLFSGFGNIYRYKLLQSQQVAGQLRARNKIENILATIARNYFNTAMAKERLEIAKQSLKISRIRLQNVKDKQEYGQVNSADVLSAQVDYNRPESPPSSRTVALCYITSPWARQNTRPGRREARWGYAGVSQRVLVRHPRCR